MQKGRAPVSFTEKYTREPPDSLKIQLEKENSTSNSFFGDLASNKYLKGSCACIIIVTLVVIVGMLVLNNKHSMEVKSQITAPVVHQDAYASASNDEVADLSRHESLTRRRSSITHDFHIKYNVPG